MADEQDNLDQVPAQPLTLMRVISTNVDSVGYDDKRQTLVVKFLGRAPKWYGATYEYPNVDRSLYLRMMAADSKGKFVRDVLDHLPHMRVS